MLRIQLICVGKLKERFYIDACDEYDKRLQRYCALERLELPESGDLERDAAAVLGRIPAGSFVVALCVEGKPYSSEELAALLSEQALQGRSRVTFLIGGSDGLSDTVKKAADVRLSMSRMTFPHHLARVMVLEQIYRAFNILGGGKYHK
ncbi:MAG: 23S rRNA (pseudouridine(1915)-N(3))-methyltransferase RlmH [Oscillospiraceae bacterium]|nr:23S rRNA (pseudouridine(1915)-N(3))-methyltransferase RlmH [Oscillospiraceae bacterium]